MASKLLRWGILPVTAVLAAMAAWNYVFAYRAADAYNCDGAFDLHVSHPYIPVIGWIVFNESLEVYIGGWIDRGSVSISGDIIDEPFLTTARGRPVSTEISYARMGEWYGEDFHVKFEPDDMASCHIEIIYRFRGLY